MRYVIAVLVAGFLIAAGFAFVWQTRHGLQVWFEQVKNDLKAKKAAGQLSQEWEGVDLDKLSPSQVGMQVPSSYQTRLDIADFLAGFWYVLIPLAFAVCVGVAVLLGWLWGAHA